MFSTAVIAVLGVLLLIGTVIPGIRLYWPKRHDDVTRSDLGIALMTGAFIAFSVLALQLVIQVRSQRDANARADEADRQALLLLLGRSKQLSSLDLHKKDLTDGYLNGKVLRSANLEQATLTRAQLQDANLVGANLARAKLDRAHLERADLRHADLAGANLADATLTGIKLDAADLTPWEDGSKLIRVDLSRADLSNASARADLRHAVLTGANLVGARLAPANLQGADLTGADLQFADLRGANLKGANLRGARNLDEVKDLSLARYDAATRWPHGFEWPPPPGDPKEPSCDKATCVLKKTTQAVHDFPPELDTMRKELEAAAKAPGCLPGWLVDAGPFGIEAHAPDPRGIDRAVFRVSAWHFGRSGVSAQSWADAFGDRSAHPIDSIRADAGSTYAVRSVRGTKNRPQVAVAVWIVRGPRGFHLRGLSSPARFQLFERDFVKIFRVLGVHGDLFPSLRGEKDGCRRR